MQWTDQVGEETNRPLREAEYDGVCISNNLSIILDNITLGK